MASLFGSNIFYLVVVCVLIGEHILTKVFLKVLYRYGILKKDSSQWRRGFVGQFLRAFFSFVVMGLLGFKEEFGLTLQNVNESLWLLLSLGLPFAILFACGAFILMRKG